MFDTKLAAWILDSQTKDQNYTFATLLLKTFHKEPSGHSMTLFASDLVDCMELAHHLKGLIQHYKLTEALYRETRVPPVLASTSSHFLSSLFSSLHFSLFKLFILLFCVSFKYTKKWK